MEEQLQGLSVEEDAELLLYVDLGGQQPSQASFCLLRWFLTDKALNFNVKQNRMASAWRPVTGVCVKDIGSGLYLFHFFHKTDMIRVLDGGPQSFDNCMLILHRLCPGEDPLSIPI
ncbi:hypothetical protein PTKIN_Ptkin02bG0195600 [Pterospermum kingtungense]